MSAELNEKRYNPEPTEQQRRENIETMRKRAETDPKFALEFLQKEGILGIDGKLTAPYKSQ